MRQGDEGIVNIVAMDYMDCVLQYNRQIVGYQTWIPLLGGSSLLHLIWSGYRENEWIYKDIARVYHSVISYKCRDFGINIWNNTLVKKQK